MYISFVDFPTTGSFWSLLTFSVSESYQRHSVCRNRAKVAISADSDSDLDLSHPTPDCCVVPALVRGSAAVAIAGVGVSPRHSRGPPPFQL